MNTPLIYNIQKRPSSDGEAIETIVFFKGCPLSCKWCQNPESQSYKREILFYEERCVSCRECISYCPAQAIQDGKKMSTDYDKCNGCGICVQSCMQGARELQGQEFKVDHLIEKLTEDMMFYNKRGNEIILSGGEVMVQNKEYIKELVTKLAKKEFHITITTSGYAPLENFQMVLPYVSQFVYEIKCMDSKRHKALTGVENRRILSNLTVLSHAGANLIIRIPLIRGVNDSEEELLAVIHYLTSNHIQYEYIALQPYEETGKHKYQKLSRIYKGRNYEAPGEKRLMQILTLFKANGITKVRITK